MWRTALLVLLAGIVGSVAGTILFGLLSGDSPDTFAVRVYAAIAVGAMWFAIPGAFLLDAVELLLRQRRLSHTISDAIVIAVGAIAGEAVGALVDLLAGVGALYGFTTAIAFVALRRVRVFPFGRANVRNGSNADTEEPQHVTRSESA